MTLITLCRGCEKQITVKVDTMAKYRKNQYYCAECETGGNTALATTSDISLDIYDGDGTSNNLDAFRGGVKTTGGRYISMEERKYNKLKILVSDLQN